MKRFYFIFTFPVVLLVVFSGIYWQFSKSTDEAERLQKEKAAQTKLVEDQKKKDEEAKARRDSDQRIAERIAEEKAKEDERIARYEAESKRIVDEGQQYATQLANNNREVAELTKQLAELRATKEMKTRELLETATESELAAIAKRRAELEVQRMTEMVARKASTGPLAKR
jgi:Flp pilus assembly protein TadB